MFLTFLSSISSFLNQNGQTLQRCDLLASLGDKDVDSRRRQDQVLAWLGREDAKDVLTSYQKSA